MTSKALIVAAAACLVFGAALYGCNKSEDRAEATAPADVQQAEQTVKAAEATVAQANCPVMGGPINKSIHVDYKGQRVYFCCGGCISTFNSDPEKYIKKLTEQGVALEKVPEAGK